MSEEKTIEEFKLIIPFDYVVLGVKEKHGSGYGKLDVKRCRKHLESIICDYIANANPKISWEEAKENCLDQYVSLVIADKLGLDTIPVDLLKHPELEKHIYNKE